MKKVLIALLTVVPLAALAENFGLTVDSVSANTNGAGFYEVSFVEGNPIPGPTGCNARYRFNGNDPSIVALINRSGEEPKERMVFTLRDALPAVRTPCDVVGVGTIN